MVCLSAYHWPGNIRELRNELGRAMALGDGLSLNPAGFSGRVLQGCIDSTVRQLLPAGVPQQGTLAERLDAIEAALIREILLRHHGNKTRVAKELGLSRVGLRAKMRRYGLEEA